MADYAINEGMPAPDFVLPDAEGAETRLSDFRGRKLILYFYPRDNTPGCTTEALDFKLAGSELDSLGATVVGLSKDSCASHVRFRDKHELPFLLLSDTSHEVIEAYDAWREKKMYGKTTKGTERSTFLVDEEGIIRKVWRKVRVKGHVDEVLDALREMN